MLPDYINDFKKQYGNARVEHFRVIKHGKIIGDKVGKEGSVETWSNVQDCDVIHNHTGGNPAFSEMDIIMTTYGNANSVTAVSATRGSWTLMRPASGWRDIDHRTIESEYKKARAKEKKSDETQVLLYKMRNKQISMSDGEGIFAERYATIALNKLGFNVTKRR
jgi:hypothetical protein